MRPSRDLVRPLEGKPPLLPEGQVLNTWATIPDLANTPRHDEEDQWLSSLRGGCVYPLLIAARWAELSNVIKRTHKTCVIDKGQDGEGK